MKDPLQPGPTPYETLGVEATATAEEIDRAFRTRLAGHKEIQKLTAARRALQDPMERALVNLFLFHDATLATLSPNAIQSSAALLPPERWTTARAWDLELRARYLDPDVLQTMGVLWFWSALHLELAGGKSAGGAPPLREQWERVIACWAALSRIDAYWRRLPVGDDLKPTMIERLRSRLQDCEQPYRDRGDAAGAALYQELEEALDTELLTAGELAAAGPGRASGGQLMLRYLGGGAGAAQAAPVSHAARIRTLLNRGNPQAAAQALAAIPEADRRSDEGCALGAEVYLAVGRELASLDRADEALGAWEKALRFGETPVERDVLREIAHFCQARAAALQRSDRAEALRLLERGVQLAPVEKLKQTLAELVTQDGIERINTAFDASTKAGRVTPGALEAVEHGRREIQRAAALGSQRAAEQLKTAGALLVRMRWYQRVVATVDFNDLPRRVRERFVACLRSEQQPNPVHSELAPATRSASGGVMLAVLGLFMLATYMSIDWGLDSSGGSHSATALFVGYVPLLFLAIFGVGWTFKQRAAARTLPFRPGRYLFPVGFIDARTRALRVIPFLRVRKIEPESAPYGLSLKMIVDDAETHSLPIYFREAAKTVFDKLDQATGLEQTAMQNGDAAALLALDPLGDLYGAAPPPPDKPADADVCVVRDVPDYFRWTAAAAVAGAIVLAVPTWAIRNYTSDTQRFEMAQATGTEARLLQYIAVGGRFEEAARAALPGAALKDARSVGTIAALRQVIKKYPKTPEATDARADVSKIYADSLAKYQGLAPKADARIVPFLKGLLGYLESHEQTNVAVRFQAPTVAAEVRDELGGTTSEGREKDVYQRLETAFTKIFRADVLQLVNRGRAIDVPAARREGPLMLIRYNITTEGRYELERSGREFWGIRVAFAVVLMMPESSNDLSFFLSVRPPSTFTVSTYSSSLLGTTDPSSYSVYDTMAARAFDQLNEKLQEVFFGVRMGSQP